MTNSKQHYIVLFIFIFSSFLIMTQSCSDTQRKTDITAGIFNPEELITLNEIVGYYDSIVSSKLPENTIINLAYDQYLDSVSPLIMKNGDMSLSGIDVPAREKLFNKLDQYHLSEIFIVGDTLKYFSMAVRRTVKKYYPHHVKLNTNGKYVDLLKRLSEESTFISKYYDSIIEYGDLSPSCYGMMLRDHNQLNFSNPYHRLLIIVNILHANEHIKDRFSR